MKRHSRPRTFAVWVACLVPIVCIVSSPSAEGAETADELSIADVEGQPLAANALRVLKALEYLGAPLPHQTDAQLRAAAKARDARKIQALLDAHVLIEISINPELRVKVAPGPGSRRLWQGGYTPKLVKILNDATIASRLKVSSPQAGPVYAGAARGILQRQAQTELIDNANREHATDRFLSVDMFGSPPMTKALSGLEVEYQLALIYSSESGRREATLVFDVGQGTQDLGFRSEAPILFDIMPAVSVPVAVTDHDGTPTTARITIRDAQGHIYPPQAKRLAPDFFFQPHIYRSDGDTILLPPGKFTVQYTRGPEYIRRTVELDVSADRVTGLALNLERWIQPSDFGYYCGDHHIHAAGCSHYESPTQGVTPADMFRQIKGEALHVGCVLTWGPCFDFQRQYFSPKADELSEPMTVMKYDLEISGFGSAAMGHVCLLNLSNQVYPDSAGTKTQGWPTWTVPVLRWAKAQGGYTGFPHSAFAVDEEVSAKWLLDRFDANRDGQLDRTEAGQAVLPSTFDTIDSDQSDTLSADELSTQTRQAKEQLPNLAIPNMNGRGALEICVSTAEGVCDFISAMDTSRTAEWNTWYHLMNCGFPLKVSGETDFPCMSGRRVGQGRVYVQLGNVDKVDFATWCRGLAEGRSYVSDGFAHAFEFRVNGQPAGPDPLRMRQQDSVNVTATVAFAPAVPEGVAYGNEIPTSGREYVGDTVNLHARRSERLIHGGTRTVELIVNGKVAGREKVPADGKRHKLAFNVPLQTSSWVALRQFPQLHTNPVTVLIADRPIRASRNSARWCEEVVRSLWAKRQDQIAEREQREAEATYERVVAKFQQIAKEAGVP